MSIKEVFAYLGVYREAIYRRIECKGIPVHKISNPWKFKISEVNEWIKSSQVAE